MEFTIHYTVRIPDFAKHVSPYDLPIEVREYLQKIGIDYTRFEIYQWEALGQRYYILIQYIREYPIIIEVVYDPCLKSFSINILPVRIRVSNEHLVIETLDKMYITSWLLKI